jgi:pimeloyl-ACP methyl ester carboxylesterase
VATFVIVPGGFVGGWFYERLVRRLEETGHRAFAPTLTGLAERAGDGGEDTDLSVHATDVLHLLHREDLRDVVLVGHSYSGMVVTAVAEMAPERIAHLVYLDALVPRDGESMADLLGPDFMAGIQAKARQYGDGWRVPLPFPLEAIGIVEEADVDYAAEKFSPQPIATVREPVRLGNPAAATIPRTFVYLKDRPLGLVDESALRAREAGWDYRELDLPHAAPFVAPGPIAELLGRIPS